MRRFLFVGILLLALSAVVFAHPSQSGKAILPETSRTDSTTDSIATRKTIIAIINTVINASVNFDISAVGNFYTPNALVADEEPPFSWNGPTAGAQWINTVEKTCKDLKIKKLKGRMGRINVYLQSDESIYVIVPATYSGEVKEQSFEEEGAFTFVFRLVNGKWLIKSQVWMARKGM